MSVISYPLIWVVLTIAIAVAIADEVPPIADTPNQPTKLISYTKKSTKIDKLNNATYNEARKPCPAGSTFVLFRESRDTSVRQFMDYERNHNLTQGLYHSDCIKGGVKKHYNFPATDRLFVAYDMGAIIMEDDVHFCHAYDKDVQLQLCQGQKLRSVYFCCIERCTGNCTVEIKRTFVDGDYNLSFNIRVNTNSSIDDVIQPFASRGVEIENDFEGVEMCIKHPERQARTALRAFNLPPEPSEQINFAACLSGNPVAILVQMKHVDKVADPFYDCRLSVDDVYDDETEKHFNIYKYYLHSQEATCLMGCDGCKNGKLSNMQKQDVRNWTCFQGCRRSKTEGLANTGGKYKYLRCNDENYSKCAIWHIEPFLERLMPGRTFCMKSDDYSKTFCSPKLCADPNYQPTCNGGNCTIPFGDCS